MRKEGPDRPGGLSHWPRNLVILRCGTGVLAQCRVVFPEPGTLHRLGNAIRLRRNSKSQHLGGSRLRHGTSAECKGLENYMTLGEDACPTTEIIRLRDRWDRPPGLSGLFPYPAGIS